MNINANKINSFLFGIYIFISELTLPFKYFFNSALAVWIISGIALVLFFFFNQFKIIDRKKLFAMSIVGIFFVVNYFLSNDDEAFFLIFTNFIKFVFIPLLIFLIIDDYAELFRALRKVAILAFFILLPFMNLVSQRGDADFMNYMEYGNGLAKCFLFIFLSFIFVKDRFIKKVILFLILVCIIAVIFSYGNRGSLVAIFLLIFCHFFYDSRMSVARKIVYFSIISTFGVLFYLNINYLIDKVYEYTNALGIHSYSIAKIKMALDSGVTSTIGERNELLDLSLQLINQNYGLPGGITYFNETTGLNYPHNIILDLTLNFGIIFTFCFLIYFVFILFGSNKEKKSYPLLLIFIFSVSILLFSQTFWFYTLFWLYPCYQIFNISRTHTSV